MCQKGHLEVVETLIKAGGDVLLLKMAKEECSCLHVACRFAVRRQPPPRRAGRDGGAVVSKAGKGVSGHVPVVVALVRLPPPPRAYQSALLPSKSYDKPCCISVHPCLCV